jgi:hypothetical protein
MALARLLALAYGEQRQSAAGLAMRLLAFEEPEHAFEAAENTVEAIEARLRETWTHERPELREAATG